MSSSSKSASRPKRPAAKPAPRKKPAKKSAAARLASPAARRKGVAELARLLDIMARLRRPGDGCPWDLEQTIDTIKPNLIEEAYEALDAMESGNRAHLTEELGDLLLQIVFQAQIAAQEGSFNFADVAKGISEKLIRRHPHIFGDVKVADSKEVLRNWDAIKKTEKKARISALDGIPKHVPPLHRAYQAQKLAARVGFDWSDVSGAFQKLTEEIGELQEALAAKNRKHIVEEIGDLLFSVVNVARFAKVDPAYALELTNAKFIRRFRAVEDEIVAGGRRMKDCTLAEMDAIWDKIRAADKKS
jgi:MazG family protein